MEHRSDVCTDEDRDFVVDDGYNAEEDPTYVPDEEESSDDDKYVVTGKDFVKLTKKAKKLGAESLDYSKRKNDKYVATLPGGKKCILDHHNIQTFSYIKTKSEKIDI